MRKYHDYINSRGENLMANPMTHPRVIEMEELSAKEHVCTGEPQTQTVEHEQLRDVTVAWGGCLET